MTGVEKFSFIIPCYNEEKDIETTIQACINQKYNGKYEIIIINDGSSDNSLNVIKNYIRKDEEKIRLYSYDNNQGVSYARNMGIRNAQGDVLIFINADERPEELFLKKMKEHFSNGADYIFPKSQVENCETGYGLYRDAYRKYNYTNKKKVMWSQGFACRKFIIEKVEMFNTKYPGCGGEDWDIVAKIDMLSMCRVVDNKIEVKHVVPNDIKGIMWHMYNRGRGTAYNQLIYDKKTPQKILGPLVLKCIFYVLLLFITRGTFLLFYVLYCVEWLNEAFEMAKVINKKRCIGTIFGLSIIDKLLRKIGYLCTTIGY